MPKSINDWLAEGASLYDNAVGEYRELESRLAELEAQLAGKLNEVNKLATVIQKPTLESRNKGGVTIIDRPPPERAPSPDRSSSDRTSKVVARPGGGMVDVTPATAFPASRNIAQAIAGKGI